MRRTGGDRIVQVYIDAHWRQAPPQSRLDVPTARALRKEGITMVRVAPGLWRRLTGRSRGVRGRDISVTRFLASADPGPMRGDAMTPHDEAASGDS